jgi:hypothetical protein
MNDRSSDPQGTAHWPTGLHILLVDDAFDAAARNGLRAATPPASGPHFDASRLGLL